MIPRRHQRFKVPFTLMSLRKAGDPSPERGTETPQVENYLDGFSRPIHVISRPQVAFDELDAVQAGLQIALSCLS